MIRYVLGRIGLMIPSLLGLIVLSFLMIRLLPADPAIALAGENATPAQIEALRARYGFDRNIVEQFIIYLQQIAQLDFGVSVFSQRPVALDLRDRLPATLELTLVALFLSIVIGIPAGIVAAVWHNRWPDFIIRFISVAGIGVATFWFALLMQLFFTMQLRWLPLAGRLTTGMEPPPFITGLFLVDSLITLRFETFWVALAHITMPAVTLSLAGIATIARFTRAGMLETLQKDFITYERAAGYPAGRITWIYALRPSVAAAITQIGLLFGALIAGSVIVETVFTWPGIGTYATQAIFAADYKPMLAVTLLVGFVYAFVNLLVDIALAVLDPRIAESR